MHGGRGGSLVHLFGSEPQVPVRRQPRRDETNRAVRDEPEPQQPNKQPSGTHSMYWHFSYAWRSCSHLKGRYSVLWRHLLRGMSMWAQ